LVVNCLFIAANPDKAILYSRRMDCDRSARPVECSLFYLAFGENKFIKTRSIHRMDSTLLVLLLLTGLGIIAGFLSRRLFMSGKLALSFAFMPLAGVALTQVFC